MSFKKSNSIFPKSETVNYNDYLNRKKGITIINNKKSYGSKIKYFMSYNEFINILKTYFYYLSKNNISRVPTKTLNQSNNSVVLYDKIKQHCYNCNECSYYNNFCESSCETLKRVLYPYGVNFDYYSSFTNNSNINFDLINNCNTKSKYSDKSNVILSCSREWYPVPIINKDCSNCNCNPCNCCYASNNHTESNHDNSKSNHDNSKSNHVTIHNHNNSIINGVCKTPSIENEDSLCEKISLCGKTYAFFSDKQIISSYTLNDNLNSSNINNCNSQKCNTCN